MKQKLKRAILNIVLSDKEQIKLRTNSSNLPDDLIPISNTSDKDIFIAGYPKSGNTWMQNLIAGVLFGISTEFLPDSLTQELVPDVHYKKYYKRFLDFNCFKTHHLPKPEYKRVIYLVRDPRDVLISYYHFKKNFYGDADIIKMINDKNGELFEWKKHTEEWLKNPFNSEIIIIRYEDLITDTLTQLRLILDFIGIERSDEVLLKVIEGNSFKNMKMKEDLWGFDNDAAKKKRNGRFFRKGQIGNYKDELSENQIMYINELAAKELIFFHYD